MVGREPITVGAYEGYTITVDPSTGEFQAEVTEHGEEREGKKIVRAPTLPLLREKLTKIATVVAKKRAIDLPVLIVVNNTVEKHRITGLNLGTGRWTGVRVRGYGIYAYPDTPEAAELIARTLEAEATARDLRSLLRSLEVPSEYHSRLHGDPANYDACLNQLEADYKFRCERAVDLMKEPEQ